MEGEITDKYLRKFICLLPLQIMNLKAMEQTVLLLTRHGETLENKRDIMQGHMPGTLSPLGIRQAEQLAVKLEDEEIDVIVCSDLKRSVDTAEIIAGPRGLSPCQTKLLREIDWGKYTGGHLTEMDWNHLPEGCESLESLLHRAGLFVAWLQKEYSGLRVLAVGHGAIDRAIAAYIEGKQAMDMVDMPIMKNTEVVRFVL